VQHCSCHPDLGPTIHHWPINSVQIWCASTEPSLSVAEPALKTSQFIKSILTSSIYLCSTRCHVSKAIQSPWCTSNIWGKWSPVWTSRLVRVPFLMDYQLTCSSLFILWCQWPWQKTEKSPFVGDDTSDAVVPTSQVVLTKTWGSILVSRAEYTTTHHHTVSSSAHQIGRGARLLTNAFSVANCQQVMNRAHDGSSRKFGKGSDSWCDKPWCSSSFRPCRSCREKELGLGGS